jgi:hypothetical protein
MSWKTAAAQRAKEKAAGANFKLVEGENTIRLAPNKHDLAGKSEDLDMAPFAEIRMHYGVGPDNIPARCGKDVDGRGKCWLCDEQIPKLAESSSTSRQKMADDMSASDCLVVQVFPVEDGHFRKAQPWWVSAKRLAVTVLQLLGSTKRSYTHPAKGFNITVTRTGTGLKTQYSAAIPDDGPSRVPKVALETIQDFKEVLPAYSLSKQKAAFFGKEESADDQEPDEEPEELDEEPEELDEEPEELDDDFADEEPEELDEDFEDEEPEELDEDFEDEEPEELDEEPEDLDDDFEDEEPEPEEPPKRKPRKAPAKKPTTKKPSQGRTTTKRQPARKATKKVAKKTARGRKR